MGLWYRLSTLGLMVWLLSVPVVAEKVVIPAGKREVVRQVAVSDAKSLRYLGLAYFKGHNASKDVHKAYQLFTQAARMKDAPAQFYLGRCYLEGLGADSDKALAYLWFSLSALQASSVQKTAIRLKQQALKSLTTEQKEKTDRLVRQLQSFYVQGPVG